MAWESFAGVRSVRDEQKLENRLKGSDRKKEFRSKEEVPEQPISKRKWINIQLRNDPVPKHQNG
jgi:hypothetical protein